MVGYPRIEKISRKDAKISFMIYLGGLSAFARVFLAIKGEKTII